MHDRTIPSCVIASLLVACSLSLANAAEQTPVLRLDLRQFGYNEHAPAGPGSQTLSRIWFKGSSLTVEVLTRKYDAQHQWVGDNLSDTWTFDITSQKLVSKQAFVDLEPPPTYASFSWAPGEVARWKEMIIARDDHGALFLQQANQSPIVIFPGSKERLRYTYDCPARAKFMGLDRIAILNCSRNAIVVDYRGQRKYTISTDLVDGNAVLNRDGTDFAVYQYSLSPKKWLLFLANGLNEETFIPADQAYVKVYSSQDGTELFKYAWRLDKDQRYDAGSVALSEDGSLVALIRNSELLIFRIAARHN
jgi:hypothetical protein